MVNFPAPIGGTVLPVDFAPSILFAVLYGLLSPFVFCRIFHRRSRCTLLIGTAIFSIERIVVFSLRAVQAHSEQKRFTNSLIDYLQTSFGMGFIGIATDLVQIVRCLLVNPTYGPERYPESAAGAKKDGVMTAPPEGTPDLTKKRFWIRRFCGTWGLAFLAATVPGIIANSHYHKVFDNQGTADNTAKLRLLSTAMALGLNFVTFSSVVWGLVKLPRISKPGALLISLLIGYISVIAIYRLSVMSIRTTSMTDSTPLNTSRGKALFYVFHVFPEWLATFTLLVAFNVRKTVGTGPMGDWRFMDETESQKARRLKNQAKKENKKDGNTSDKEMGIPLVGLQDGEKKERTMTSQEQVM